MKKTKRFLSILLAFVMVMTLLPMPAQKAYAYALTINNIAWGTGENEKVLTWDPVEGAAYYVLTVGPGVGYIYDTTKNCQGYILETGTYTPKLIAYDESGTQLTDEVTGPSKDFTLTPLMTPGNVELQGTKIVWDQVPNATGYSVLIYNYNESQPYDHEFNSVAASRNATKNSISLAAFVTGLDNGNKYYIAVYASDGNHNYGKSGYGCSTFFTYDATFLPEVQNIAWGTGANEKVLTWSPVEGAVRYDVSVGAGGGWVTETRYDAKNIITQTGTYNTDVTAYDEDDIVISRVTTGPSKDFVVTPLDTPTNVQVVNGVATWQAVTNATRYMVNLYRYDSEYPYSYDFDRETWETANTNSYNLSDFASSIEDGHDYYLGIVAWDDTYTYGDSEYGYGTYFTYHIIYQVNTSVSGNGGTVTAGGSVNKGDSYAITCTPNTGYLVSYVKVNGQLVTDQMVGNVYTITNASDDYTVEAAFTTCTHSWGSPVVKKAATCGETGIREYTCSVCHDTKTENIAKLTNHSYDAGTVQKSATCSEDGLKVYTCTVCNAKKQEAIGKTGVHTYGEYAVTKNPTCISIGIKTRACSSCGLKDEISIDALGHVWNAGEVTKVATCAETGTKHFCCTRANCDGTKDEVIAKDMTNHVGGTTLKNKKDENCTEDGYTGDVCCKGCDTVLTAGKTIAAKGHKFESGKCITCGEADSNYVPVDPVDVTINGIYIAANDHEHFVAGVVADSSDKSKVEYSWWAYKESLGWFLISDWKLANEWVDWTPDEYGDYVIAGRARSVGDSKTEVMEYSSYSYHPEIKGICQIPYEGEGGGYLIGIESYTNPGNTYRYEMMILDCTLYAQGLDAWVYTTTPCVTDGTCLWTVWQPLYGYYWTLFRIYDENGVLIDEQCYGFANV